MTPVIWHEVSKGEARELGDKCEKPLSSLEMESLWKVLKAEE